MRIDQTYEALIQQNKALQNKLAKYSSLQQELINTKDVIDQELVRYKRMNSFFSEAVRQNDLDQLLTLSSEAIVDIFEYQIGYVYLKKINSNEEKVNSYIEGATSKNKEEILLSLNKLSEVNIFSGIVKRFDENDLQLYSKSEVLSFALISKKLTIGADFSLYIGAAVEKNHKGSYNINEPTKESLFSLFIQQLDGIVINLITLKENKENLLLIQKSEIELKKLSLIATNTHNAIIISDSYGRIEWINEAFSQLSGYSMEEIRGKKPKDIVQVIDDRTLSARELLKEKLKNAEFVETQIINRNKNGKEYVVEVQITPILNGVGDVINFIAIQKDITQEVQQKNELLRMNHRINEITKGTKVGMWEFNTRVKMTEWNEVLYEIYEIDKSSLVSKFEIWKKSIHPDDLDQVLSSIAKLESGEIDKLEIEYRLLIRDKLKFVKTIAFVEFNSEGEKLIMGSTTDISESKDFENTLILKNEELSKINNELDQFVYSVSHDLRAPLLSVKGVVSLMEDSEIDEANKQYLTLIEASVNRLDQTILEILEYSRNSRLDLEIKRFDLTNQVLSIFKDLEHLSEKQVKLAVSQEDSFMVDLDEKRLEKLLYNLISNGIKYSDASKVDPFVLVTMMQDDNFYQITVSDNGEGIEERHHKNIFDMFYRASVKKNGTGLGLYLCKEIVSKMKGELTLKSQRGVGSEFFIKLPKTKY